MMKLSVIVPCYNAATTIVETLEALLPQDPGVPWELIVADNGSTDCTRELVRNYVARHERMRLVDASRRRGPGPARNVGAAAAQGELLAFCDADDVASDTWLKEITAGIEEFGFVASRMDSFRLNDPVVARQKSSLQSKGLMHYDYVEFLPHAGTSGMGVRKELHEKVDGFDEAFECCEDCDYCWKLQLAGHQLVFLPEALIHVRFRNQIRGHLRQARQWGKYNVLLVKKYRRLGMPKPGWRAAYREWSRLLGHLRRIRNPVERTRFLWNGSFRLGHVIGSLRYGCFAL
jgi:glycosyltransferase involved in cell wall biosynthesis